VVDFRKELYGLKHEFTLTTLSSVAMTCDAQKKFVQEEGLLQTIIRGRVEVLGSAHAKTLGSIQALAINYMNQKLPEKADPLFKKLVETRSGRLDFRPTHPSTLVSRDGLARACFEQSRIEEATTMQQNTVGDGAEKLSVSH
jgi:hypothetical protein